MKNLSTKVLKLFFPALLVFGLLANVASAHVEVTPKTSAIGEEETYTVKVPSEKEVPTIKFVIKIPSGLEFDSFEPVAGWKITTQKGSDNKVKSITYEADGQGILPDQFQRFVFVAKNPDKAVTATWDAYQYYKDGTIVEWTGAPGSETPHSITTIVSETGNGQPDSQKEKQTSSIQTANPSSPASEKGSSLTLTISIIAALLSIVSLFISIRRK